MDSTNEVDGNVLLFDGVCNLCNGFVNFIIDWDKDQKIRFASLQSDYGANLMSSYGLDTTYFDSVVFVRKGQVYTRSRGALEVLRLLGLPWSILYAGIIIPGVVRDCLYNYIARNRYRWFGKRDTCRVPTPELRERFLDS
ncbi:thiol-disulfide oxidoreductase DCC family protein [Marinoscillum sp. MHG1-6]|uniref:thiol-disulfide oxidoreductase DCC family protein n=1 Tax=Marinoscillum sp. MHG1-6 TaxID=2959627 RepID=UPI002157B950|nr:thiol-disulfide oxidoreductase DCC family protein [Marinoscillum sp. MHG1-6]